MFQRLGLCAHRGVSRRSQKLGGGRKLLAPCASRQFTPPKKERAKYNSASVRNIGKLDRNGSRSFTYVPLSPRRVELPQPTSTFPGKRVKRRSDMTRPDSEQRRGMCTKKRRYASEGLALQAAAMAGVERGRTAYRCPLCGQWHLASR